MLEVPVDEPNEEFARAQAELLRLFNAQVESHYVKIAKPQMQVHLLEGGSGEPVILIHRSGGIAVGWLPLLSALEANFHIIAPDSPGCGLTDKVNYRSVDLRRYAVTFIESLLDCLGVSKAAFVGNSIGGYYSLVFALAHPERVTKIVLVGAPVGIDKSIPRFIRLLGIRCINRLLYAGVSISSLRGTREMFRQTLVADLGKVPPEYLRCSYLSRLIPGADLSWLTMLEQLVTFKGVREEYLISRELLKIQQPGIS